jgi:hypothetical protein
MMRLATNPWGGSPTRPAIVLAGFAWWALGALGCALLEDGSAGGATYSGGTAQSTSSSESIDELTNSDLRALCEGFVEEFIAGIGSDDELCRWIGVESATGSTDVELLYDCYLKMTSCQQDGTGALTAWRRDALNACASDPVSANTTLARFADCPASTAALQACLDEDVRGWLTPLNYTCEDLSPGKDTAASRGDPLACQKLEAQCTTPALSLSKKAFLGSCEYSYEDSKRECLERYCDDCSAAERDTAGDCPDSTDSDGTNLPAAASDGPCSRRNSSIGGCVLSTKDGEPGTTHLALFVWPTDGSTAAKYRAECEAGGNTYLPPR